MFPFIGDLSGISNSNSQNALSCLADTQKAITAMYDTQRKIRVLNRDEAEKKAAFLASKGELSTVYFHSNLSVFESLRLHISKLCEG